MHNKRISVLLDRKITANQTSYIYVDYNNDMSSAYITIPSSAIIIRG